MSRLKRGACVFCLAALFCGMAFTADSGASPALLIPVRVKGVMPHNPAHFTQGLFFFNGFLYESTGRYGQSALYRLDPRSGKEIRSLLFPAFFVEGGAALNGIIHLLTWRDGVRFALRETDLAPLAAFSLPGEGWGLCAAGSDLWLSDGSPVLRRMRPDGSGDWKEMESLIVTDAGRPVPLLNELEWMRGLLLANVWLTDRIAVLDPAAKDPQTGECPVLFWLDCSRLSGRHKSIPEGVLNGIAWDDAAGRLLLVGKLWPFFYEVDVPEEMFRNRSGRQDGIF